jgi:hypothetical protein
MKAIDAMTASSSHSRFASLVGSYVLPAKNLHK